MYTKRNMDIAGYMKINGEKYGYWIDEVKRRNI